MTRMMYDGVNPDAVPAGAAIYAGYLDGEWQSYDVLTTLYPAALHLSVCVTPTDDAQVLDVENGDASPEQAPGWVERQRAAGNPFPVVYCNQANTWPAVRQAFADQAIPEPLYWVAAYVDDPTQVPELPDDAIALQFYDYGGYDASVAADYWPGLDPAPTSAAASTTTVLLEEELMQIEPLSAHPGEYAFAFAPDKTELVLVADGYSAPPASLRIAIWNGDGVQVLNGVGLGGSSGVHTWGHTLAPGTTGVTVRRLDSEGYPVGVAFK